MQAAGEITRDAAKIRTPREALAVLGAGAELLAAQQRDVSLKLRESRTAAADLASAEAALRELIFEEAVSGKTEAARREELGAKIREARTQVATLRELEAEHARLGRELEANTAARRAKVRKIIEAEAIELARTYHHHARIAVAAEAAIKGLADWALTVEQDSALGVSLRALTLPDQRSSEDAAQVRADLQERLDQHSRAWSALPIALLRDGRAAAPAFELEEPSR